MQGTAEFIVEEMLQPHDAKPFVIEPRNIVEIAFEGMRAFYAVNARELSLI